MGGAHGRDFAGEGYAASSDPLRQADGSRQGSAPGDAEVLEILDALLPPPEPLAPLGELRSLAGDLRGRCGDDARSMLLGLPHELTLYVLGHLKRWRNVLACAAVCSTLRRMVFALADRAVPCEPVQAVHYSVDDRANSEYSLRLGVKFARLSDAALMFALPRWQRGGRALRQSLLGEQPHQCVLASVARALAAAEPNGTEELPRSIATAREATLEQVALWLLRTRLCAVALHADEVTFLPSWLGCAPDGRDFEWSQQWVAIVGAARDSEGKRPFVFVELAQHVAVDVDARMRLAT